MDIANETIVFEESVIVEDGGCLVVTNATVVFNCSSPLEFGIRVRDGGTLIMKDLDKDPGTEYDGSELRGLDRFFLVAEAGSEIMVTNSMVVNCGGTPPPAYYMEGGIEVRTDRSLFSGARFTGSHTGIRYVDVVNGSVTDCQFDDLAWGVVGSGTKDINVLGCRFSKLSVGVWFARSRSPTVSDCRFSNVTNKAVYFEMCVDANLSGSDLRDISYAGVYIRSDRDGKPPGSGGLEAELVGTSYTDVGYPVILHDASDVVIRGCDFHRFGTAINLWMDVGIRLNIYKNVFRAGGCAIDFSARRCVEITILSNDFSKVNKGLQVKGQAVLVRGNTFDEVGYAGVMQEGDGTVHVVGNTFSNSTCGVRAERNLLFDPGLVLQNNTFRSCRCGVLVRDVDPFVETGTEYDRCDVGATLLDVRLDNVGNVTFTDCSVGASELGTRGTTGGLRFVRCDLAVLVDMGSSIELHASSFTNCTVECKATNSSRLDLVDSLHSRRFAVEDEGSSVRSLWTATLFVVYLSDGSPASGTEVRLQPSNSSKGRSHHTGPDGRLDPLNVLQCEQGPSGLVDHLPYTVEVAYRGRMHPFEVRFELVHEFELIIDDVPPSITLIAPADGQRLNVSDLVLEVMATDNGSGIDRIVIELDGTALHDGRPASDRVTLDVDVRDGTHLVTAHIWDEWGNDAGTQASFYVDARPPRFVDVTPANGTVVGFTSVVVSGIVVDGTTLLVSGKEVPMSDEGAFELGVELIGEGPNEVNLTALDELDNAAWLRLVVIRDTRPPVIELEAVPGVTNRTSVQLRGWTDGDALWVNSERVKLEGGAFNRSVPLEEGWNELEVVATDKAGNRNETAFTCLLDTVILFDVTYPESGSSLLDEIVTLECSGEAGLKYRLVTTDVDDWSVLDDSGRGNVTVHVLDRGMNALDIEFRDPAGNTGIYPYALNRLVEQPEPPDGGDRSAALLLVISILALIVVVALYIRSRRG